MRTFQPRLHKGIVIFMCHEFCVECYRRIGKRAKNYGYDTCVLCRKKYAFAFKEKLMKIVEEDFFYHPDDNSFKSIALRTGINVMMVEKISGILYKNYVHQNFSPATSNANRGRRIR